MTYGSSAWIITEKVKKMLNNNNSKMLSQITKRSIHDEAKHPSFNIIEAVLKRRWSYLGHILRMDENHPVKKFLLELSPTEAPFVEGTLLADTRFRTVDEMLSAAANRNQWKAALEKGLN